MRLAFIRGNRGSQKVRVPVRLIQCGPAKRIYVGIVSCHSLAAHHLSEIINRNPNMSSFILMDGEMGASVVPQDGRCVVLIDLWSLPLPFSEYLDAFTAAIPGCVFLALDRARNGVDVARLLQAGFAGFITHEEALSLLGTAVNAVEEGHVWTSPEVINIYMKLTSQRTAAFRGGVEVLTIRESQVLDLLRKRYSNREMASLLRISESTVKFHVSNVLMKLNVTKRRHLVDRESVGGANEGIHRDPVPA